MAIRTQEAKIMDTVIVAIAVDVVEFKRDRNFKPRIQAAPLTAVLLDTSLNSRFFRWLTP